MEQNVEREINELHGFFEQWFTGELPANDYEFKRLATVLSPGFNIVTPAGKKIDRVSLLTTLRAANGSRPDLDITIRNVNILAQLGETVLATYEEWQSEDDRAEKGRMVTVSFLAKDGLPNNLEWLHVHETWIED